jgi:glycosyltransferase involved in cell wall biosynthesis
MKVAMVSEHASPLAALGGEDAGGQNVHVGALSEALVHQGVSVVVHTRRTDPTLDRRVRTTSGVQVDHIDAGPAVAIPKDKLLPLMDRFSAGLRRRWEGDRPDVVHAHFWMSGLASLEAARPLGIPVVQTFHALGAVKRRHQGSADTSPADRLRVEACLAADVDHLIATCADEVRELRRMNAETSSLSVVPCGVDLDLFHPWGPAAPRHDRRRPRLMVIGRLVKRKGVAEVIEALRSVPAAELVIAGGPVAEHLDSNAEMRRLRSVAVAHGVADRVTFLGQVGRADLPALIRSADAVISVPLYEPFGMVPLEAMACGVPAVVSAVGGLRESVVDGVTGLHVPPGEPRVLARTLARLLDDPDLMSRLGRNGVRRVRAHYSWPSVAAATAAVYREVIATSAPLPSEAVR